MAMQNIVQLVKQGFGGLFGERLAGYLDSNFAQAGGVVGTYATAALLQAGSPAASNQGRMALVGSAAPYLIYTSDGYNWNITPSAGSPVIGFANADVPAVNTMRYKFERGKTGQAAFTLLCAGDSTSAGQTGGAGQAYAANVSYPYRLYQYLLAQGVACRYDGVYGSGFNKISVNTDPRVVINGTWTPFSGYLYQAAGLANTMDFTATGANNRLNVVYFDNGAGTLRVNPNAEGAQDVTLTNTGTMKIATFTATTNQTSNVWHVSMDAGYLAGFDAYTNGVSDVRIINMGISGMLVGGQSLAAANSPINVAQTRGFDAMWLNQGTNDSSGGTGALPAFITGMTNYLNMANGLSAQTLIISPNYNMGQSDSVLAQFQSATTTLAGTTYPLADMRLFLGNTNAAVVASGWQTDTLHPTSYFYDYWPRVIAKIVLGI